MNHELTLLEPIEIRPSGFKEEDLPALVQGQIGKLNELDQNVKKAIKAAALAKESAEEARSKSAGFGKKKVAIEELQSAGIDLADAVQSGAEAQKISFEFQTRLAEISKYLFGLGVSNIANNRSVVRELELRLKGASEEELSDLAQRELMLVLKQLKDQEDIFKKQEFFSKTLKVHNETLTIHSEKSRQMEEQLHSIEEIDSWQSEQLKKYIEHNRLQSEQLQKQEILNRRYEEQLLAHAEIDKELEGKLKAHEEVNKHHRDQLQLLAEMNESQLASQKELDKLQDEQIKGLAGKSEKHETQIAILHTTDSDLLEQVESNLKKIQEQEATISGLTEEIANLKILLDTKTNAATTKIISAVTVIALLSSGASYFF